MEWHWADGQLVSTLDWPTYWADGGMLPYYVPDVATAPPTTNRVLNVMINF